MSYEPGSFTCQELKNELKQRGLYTKGKKAQLEKRFAKVYDSEENTTEPETTKHVYMSPAMSADYVEVIKRREKLLKLDIEGVTNSII